MNVAQHLQADPPVKVLVQICVSLRDQHGGAGVVSGQLGEEEELELVFGEGPVAVAVRPAPPPAVPFLTPLEGLEEEKGNFISFQ